ncbi:hypothetical protein J1614_004875 [Plenodomus biglobosus]|nr:hypothetical protein J1614_004875 [Plenodomus biglobosus]
MTTLSPLPPSPSLYPPNTHPPSPSTTTTTTPPPPPPSIPPLVYRIHHPSSQTRYSFATGFSAKNHTTILAFTTSLSRFGLAHLHQQTNISSPFISVYDDRAHAEAVARSMAPVWREDALLVTVDTRYLARGPVFRAVDLLREVGDGEAGMAKARPGAEAKRGGPGMGGLDEEALHRGEYLVMYRIPAQAVRDQTVVARGEDQGWRAVGVIGGV